MASTRTRLVIRCDSESINLGWFRDALDRERTDELVEEALYDRRLVPQSEPVITTEVDAKKTTIVYTYDQPCECIPEDCPMPGEESSSTSPPETPSAEATPPATPPSA